ncbi:MAG: hypothetical protein O3A10_16655, partial [Chloroflexi bacterium]|nr:hypothetical protein [Chloroflexota bacterium]
MVDEADWNGLVRERSATGVVSLIAFTSMPPGGGGSSPLLAIDETNKHVWVKLTTNAPRRPSAHLSGTPGPDPKDAG